MFILRISTTIILEMRAVTSWFCSKIAGMKETGIASIMQEGRQIGLGEKIGIVARLSMPGILAQISEIVMQYIDAAMVGSLGAAASASIGLVSSSTWLFGGLLRACASGFAVQVAHAVGASDQSKARNVFRQSLVVSLLLSVILALAGSLLSLGLPQMLGAQKEIWHDARMYFLVFALFIPARQINMLCLSMLQCTGDMKTPSVCATLMCFLDVVFNFFLIFPSGTASLAGIPVPGAGLGVLGAQLGTSLSVLACMGIVLYRCLRVSPILRIERFFAGMDAGINAEAWRIGWPIAMESTASCLAQVAATRIVAPLGTVAIAANSFAVTAESLCYMPGFGIASASTTLVGQAIGARRKDLARSFAWLTTFAAMMVMSLGGVLMYFGCPYVFMFLTPDKAVRALGVQVLRIELFAEPLFAASIAANGALRGAGDTFVPGIMNLVSMWGVRITLSFFLAASMGLKGVWIAMTVELCFRGLLFLLRLKRGKWLEEK